MHSSIEVSKYHHQKLKVVAALEDLETFLKSRIAAANNHEFADQSVTEIFDQVIKENTGY